MRIEWSENVSIFESIACIVQIYEETSNLKQHIWTDHIKALDIESRSPNS